MASVHSRSGTEVRRTPDVRLRFVGKIRFVGFNFGNVQLLRFVVVMGQSYSNIESVNCVFLVFFLPCAPPPPQV